MRPQLERAPRKFPDYAPPTKIVYADGRPAALHLRRCRLGVIVAGRLRESLFDKQTVTVGAMGDNDLVVEDDTVSRYHCRIVQDADAWLLQDLGSTNGTFINRVRVREGYLKPGCTITVGETDLKFQHADERVEILPSRRGSLGGLIGRNPKMRAIYAIIEKIAPTGTTVVVEGETGTGKEVVAQAIHALSPRRSGPLMVLDCGAVPPNLIESEIFGHERGSFTGALMTRQGLFELAHGGTLFLDEIGELSVDLQPKLLRAIEQREIRRVGSSKPLRVDVRVIAATHRNLDVEVKAGRFREDLFYRLSVVRVVLPPLRERPDDVALLARHFLDTGAWNRGRAGQPRVREIAERALDLLASYAWPGNVRELANVIERAVSFCDGETIEVEHLPDQVRRDVAGVGAAAAPLADEPFKEAKERTVSRFERDYVLATLQKSGFNISHAAREADIDRKYFRKLMRKYGIRSDTHADDSDDEE
ncbi:MAG: sigma 54-interacting transcriptional regulator [Myxococcota bacterium]